MKTARATALAARIAAAVFLCSVFVSLAASLFEPASAAVRYVNKNTLCSDPAGAPYCSIAAAVARASPGDTVAVAPGTYSGQVRISRSGEPGAPIRIVASPGAIVTGGWRGFDLSGASWVTVDGFTVERTLNEGFRCTLCSNVTLSNVKVSRSTGSSILISSSSNIVLSNVAIDGSLNTGIDITGSSNISVLGGYVTRSGLRSSGKTRNGIRFSSTSSSLVDGTQVHDNSDIGIYIINGSHGIRIKRVSAHHNARGYQRIAAGIEARSSGNIVESCKSYQNEDSGINMRWGGSDGLMVNNAAYLNGDHGIDVLESPRPKIINNSVYKNTTSGINIEGDSPDGYVYNNISVDNALSTWRKKGEINISNSSVTKGANYNIVSACCGGVLYVYKGTTYYSLATLRVAHPGVETNGIQALPGWVSASGSNFHLTAGSKAIDSAKSDAISTSEISRDAEHKSRCNDSATSNTGSGAISYMDRGAYEYTSSCP